MSDLISRRTDLPLTQQRGLPIRATELKLCVPERIEKNDSESQLRCVWGGKDSCGTLDGANLPQTTVQRTSTNECASSPGHYSFELFRPHASAPPPPTTLQVTVERRSSTERTASQKHVDTVRVNNVDHPAKIVEAQSRWLDYLLLFAASTT